MTMGEMAKSMLMKLEWFDTRFPRIPVNVQKQINASVDNRRNPEKERIEETYNRPSPSAHGRSPINPLSRNSSEGAKMRDYDRKGQVSNSREPRSRSPDGRSKSKDRNSRSREGNSKIERKSRGRRSNSRERRHRDTSKDRGRRDRGKEHKSHRRSRSRSRDIHRNDKRRDENSHGDYADELRNYSEHRKKSHKRRRSRSRSRDRH